MRALPVPRLRGHGDIDSTSTQPAMSITPPTNAAIFTKLNFLSLKYLDFGGKTKPVRRPRGRRWAAATHYSDYTMSSREAFNNARRGRGLGRLLNLSESGAVPSAAPSVTINSKSAFTVLRKILTRSLSFTGMGYQRIFDPKKVYGLDRV